jgi:outer membrane receptor protein involved in Fe transport
VEATAARKLAPEEIESIEVVKGTAARRTLGEKAAAGAVYVATKARRPLGTPADSAELRALEVKGHLVRSSGQRVALMKTNGREALAEADAPLLIIDGVMTARGVTLERVDPASIERVEVVKGAAAARLYDHPRAVNGVILITTKKRDR